MKQGTESSFIKTVICFLTYFPVYRDFPPVGRSIVSCRSAAVRPEWKEGWLQTELHVPKGHNVFPLSKHCDRNCDIDITQYRKLCPVPVRSVSVNRTFGENLGKFWFRWAALKNFTGVTWSISISLNFFWRYFSRTASVFSDFFI